MKKLRLLLLTLIFSMLTLGVNAQQDTIRSLIFSEYRGGDFGNNYIELTNVGEDTLDLSRFLLQWVDGKGTEFLYEDGQLRLPEPATGGRQHYLEGELPPGDNWLGIFCTFQFITENDTITEDSIVSVVVDSIPSARPGMIDIADHYVGRPGYLFNYGSHKNVLYYFLDNGDSILVDCANLTMNEDNETTNVASDVAGIPLAAGDHILVRKANIKQGNMDWESSKGISAEDSEWIPISGVDQDELPFTTVGTHGDFDIDMASDIVGIDLNSATLTVPWGIYKHDSLIKRIDWGPGMAWQYIQDTTSTSDSAHARVMDGDILKVMAAGNELREKYLNITLADAADDQASVFPKLYINANGNWVQPYYVTVGQPGMDTIGSVNYAERVDTLFKYLEIAPKANWEIVWKEGIVKADLQNGDILKVTAPDGTTIKEYYIDVLEYVANNNVQMAAITWPDKQGYIEGWKGDTIPQFSSSKTAYQVTLPYGTLNVPALQAHPANVRTHVEVQRAISLAGSQADRTTTFSLTSESDTLTQEYSVLFSVEKDPTKIQHFEGTPFISEIVTSAYSWMSYLEIANPGTKDLDLSEYIAVRGADVIPAVDLETLVPEAPTDEDFQNRYRGYVPGFKFEDDTINWLLNPGILSVDANVNPIVKPGDVFVMAAASQNRGMTQWTDLDILDELDKKWYNFADYGRILDEQGVNTRNIPACLIRGTESLYLFKITNDSILDGTKAVGDPADYELVDAMGDPILDESWSIAGNTIVSNTRIYARRKPNIYTGVRSMVESSVAFGTHADTSDWIVNVSGTGANHLLSVDIGSHTMDPVTVHLSTVSSPVYLVSDGFSMEETLQGDLTATTVELFFGNVDKADTAQSLTLLSGTDGLPKDIADAVTGNDTLVVVSADGVNTTKYALTDLPLDNNATLVAVNDPSDFTIEEISDSTGTITGVDYGGLLKDVYEAVETASAFAVMNVIDGAGNLIPLQVTNFDSVKVDTRVGSDIYFEVIAQDGVTVITYKLEPAAMSSDAFVISSMYEVDQDNFDISGLSDGTSTELFYNNIEAVEGATATVLDKLGNERMDGVLSYDDVLRVISEDVSKTVTYFITFLNEQNPDANNAPEIELAFSDTTFADPGTIMLMATATDDGLPPPAELTYMWEATDGLIADVVIENADQPSTNATFNAKGSYVLTLTVSDGALKTTADVTVSVGGVGVEEIHAPGMFIYPNPAKDKLTLELMNMPGNTSIVSIYSITGSAVYNTKLSTEKVEIDLSAFDAGLYVIRVNSEGQSFTQRLEIQK